MLSKDIILALTGATGRFFEGNASAFFNPYNSPSDFALRATSVITAPVAFSGLTVQAIIMAGYELLKAMANMLTSNFPNAQKNLVNSVGALGASCIFLVAAILSPLANLIDLVGSAIALIKSPGNSPDDGIYPTRPVAK